MSEKTPQYIVGAHKKPDGTLDTSKALHLYPKKDSQSLQTDSAPGQKETLQESPDKTKEKEIAARAQAITDALFAGLDLGDLATKEETESPTDSKYEKLQELRDRAAEIVLKDGGVRVQTSITKELSPQRNAGPQALEIGILDGQKPIHDIGKIESRFLSPEDTIGRARFKDVLAQHGIKEIIDIHQETRPVYKEETITGNKGFLGFGKTADRTIQKATGQYEPVQHQEIVENGKAEPAVRFTYFIPEQDDLMDYSGRPGNSLSASFVLPKSAAQEVERILDQDPAAIRGIVERVMKEKLLKDPAAWETPQGHGDSLRPPYEKWDAEPGGGKIYLQKEGMEPGFHKEAFRQVKNQ